MRKYTRLSDSGSLNDGALPEFSPPFATEYELNPTSRWGKVGPLFSGIKCRPIYHTGQAELFLEVTFQSANCTGRLLMLLCR